MNGQKSKQVERVATTLGGQYKVKSRRPYRESMASEKQEEAGLELNLKNNRTISHGRVEQIDALMSQA